MRMLKHPRTQSSAPFLLPLLGILNGGILSCNQPRAAVEADSDLESDKALKQLLPEAKDKLAIESSTFKLWNALQIHGCGGCHGGDGGAGWEAQKMPYWSYWKSSVLGQLGLEDPEVSSIKVDNFHLYRILSGDKDLRMPPLEAHKIVATNKALLDQLTTNRMGPDLDAQLANAGSNLDAFKKSLGTQLIYSNKFGVCFDHRSTGLDPYAESLCLPFSELASLITKWKGDLRPGITAWQRLANEAKSKNHYDSEEGVIGKMNELPPGEIPPGTGGAEPGEPIREPSGEEVIYRTPASYTISYFIRVAPDDSWIAFTASSVPNGVRHYPYMIRVSNPTQKVNFSEIRYDPTFVSDFNVSKGTGFIVGGSGVDGSEFAKYYSFFTPGTTGTPRQKWYIDDISGYGTVAKITRPNDVNAAWTKFANQYIVMGKRWRWIAVDTVKDANGRTTDIRKLFPAGEASARAICPEIWNNNETSLNNADSMISPDGRWISLKRNPDNATVVVSTKNCKISHVVPAKNGKPITGGKATFSNDGRYLAFHAFGAEGTARDESLFANQDRIKDLANSGYVANAFVYDLDTNKLAQLTHYSNANPYVSLFPMFNGDNSILYFHRHKKGASSSEIVRIKNPLGAFR